MSAADRQRRYRAKRRRETPPGTRRWDNRLWPVCREHGGIVRRAVPGWLYCAGHGWHPRDAGERAA